MLVPQEKSRVTSDTPARETDEMLRTYVRSEQRRTNNEPTDVLAGEEVILGGALFLANHPESNAEHHNEIETHNPPVKGNQLIHPILSRSSVFQRP